MTPYLPEISLYPGAPAPRYNSYPLLPYWKNKLSTEEWLLSCKQSLEGKKGKERPRIAIYIHIPFCESLCSYCACSTYIVGKGAPSSIEENYLECLHEEFDFYRQRLPELSQGLLLQVYLGGGTPNFFSPKNLERLLSPILTFFERASGHEFSFEADIRHLKDEHLDLLRELGFRHLRFGVEDLDPKVQGIANRLQSEEQLSLACQKARKRAFSSLSFDLIYGLPRQSPKGITKSITKILKYRPEGLAYYPYIPLPQNQSIVRPFNDMELPQGEEKARLYEIGQEILLSANYQKLGMDHYVLEEHPLWQAKKEGKLYRHFTDYSREKVDLLLGLGSSAVSESANAYQQNEKILHTYQKKIRDSGSAACKSHKLSEEDLLHRKIIHELCAPGRDRTFTDPKTRKAKGKNSERLQEMGRNPRKALPKIRGNGKSLSYSIR